MVLLGPSTNPLLPWGGLGRKAFCLFSRFLQESAEVWTPVEAGLTGIRGNSWPEPCPAGGSSHSRDSGRERLPTAQSHSRSVFFLSPDVC